MQQRQSAQAELEHLFRQTRDIDQYELKQLFQQYTEAHKVEIENFIKQQISDASIAHQTIHAIDPACEIALESLTHNESHHDYAQYQVEYPQYADPIESSEQSTQQNEIEMIDQEPEPSKADHRLYYMRLQELKQVYDKAKAQYAHYESHFSQRAENENTSFEQAIANENKQDFWEGIVDALNTAHQDIEEYVQESSV